MSSITLTFHETKILNSVHRGKIFLLGFKMPPTPLLYTLYIIHTDLHNSTVLHKQSDVKVLILFVVVKIGQIQLKLFGLNFLRPFIYIVIGLKTMETVTDMVHYINLHNITLQRYINRAI